MKKKQLFLRVISGFVALVFSIQSLAWSAPETREVTPPTTPFRISPLLGTLAENYLPTHLSSEAPSLFHIQDAHAHPEAQEKIRDILAELAKKKSPLVVAFEGGLGPLHPEYLELFPEYPKVNESIVRDLNATGILSGPELFAWKLHRTKKTPEVFFRGVEAPRLYRANLKAYRDLSRHEEEIKRALRSFRESVDSAGAKVLNPDLRKFIREAARRKEGEFHSGVVSPNLPAYLQFLAESAFTHLGIDLRDRLEQIRFPSFTRLLFLLEFEKTLDPRARVLLESEIDPRGLFQEIALLEKEIREKLSRRESEKRFLEILADFELLEKLFRLELTRDEYQALLAREEEATPRALDARLTRFWKIKPSLSHLTPFQEVALHFYRLAGRRDAVLLENALKEAKEIEKRLTKKPTLVLVTGGFHTPGLTAHLRKKKVPYSVISPQMSRESPNGSRYHELMSGKWMPSFSGTETDQLSFAKILTGKSNYRRLNRPEEQRQIFVGAMRNAGPHFRQHYRRLTDQEIEEAIGSVAARLTRSEVHPDPTDPGTPQSSKRSASRAEVRSRVTKEIIVQRIERLTADLKGSQEWLPSLWEQLSADMAAVVTLVRDEKYLEAVRGVRAIGLAKKSHYREWIIGPYPKRFKSLEDALRERERLWHVEEERAEKERELEQKVSTAIDELQREKGSEINQTLIALKAGISFRQLKGLMKRSRSIETKVTAALRKRQEKGEETDQGFEVRRSELRTRPGEENEEKLQGEIRKEVLRRRFQRRERLRKWHVIKKDKNQVGKGKTSPDPLAGLFAELFGARKHGTPIKTLSPEILSFTEFVRRVQAGQVGNGTQIKVLIQRVESAREPLIKEIVFDRFDSWDFPSVIHGEIEVGRTRTPIAIRKNDILGVEILSRSEVRTASRAEVRSETPLTLDTTVEEIKREWIEGTVLAEKITEVHVRSSTRSLSVFFTLTNGEVATYTIEAADIPDSKGLKRVIKALESSGYDSLLQEHGTELLRTILAWLKKRGFPEIWIALQFPNSKKFFLTALKLWTKEGGEPAYEFFSSGDSDLGTLILYPDKLDGQKLNVKMSQPPHPRSEARKQGETVLLLGLLAGMIGGIGCASSSQKESRRIAGASTLPVQELQEEFPLPTRQPAKEEEKGFWGTAWEWTEASLVMAGITLLESYLDRQEDKIRRTDSDLAEDLRKNRWINAGLRSFTAIGSSVAHNSNQSFPNHLRNAGAVVLATQAQDYIEREYLEDLEEGRGIWHLGALGLAHQQSDQWIRNVARGLHPFERVGLTVFSTHTEYSPWNGKGCCGVDPLGLYENFRAFYDEDTENTEAFVASGFQSLVDLDPVMELSENPLKFRYGVAHLEAPLNPDGSTPSFGDLRRNPAWRRLYGEAVLKSWHTYHDSTLTLWLVPVETGIYKLGNEFGFLKPLRMFDFQATAVEGLRSLSEGKVRDWNFLDLDPDLDPNADILDLQVEPGLRYLDYYRSQSKAPAPAEPSLPKDGLARAARKERVFAGRTQRELAQFARRPPQPTPQLHRVQARRSEVHSAPTGLSTPPSSERSAPRAEVRSADEVWARKEDFKERFNALFKRGHWSNLRLAQVVGVTGPTVFGWRNGALPHPRNWPLLVQTLHTTVSGLLFGVAREKIINAKIENENDVEQKKKFGLKITVLRLEEGMTQDQLAQEIGLRSSRSVAEWEEGRSFPEPSTLKLLPEPLGTTLSELIAGQSEEALMKPWKEAPFTPEHRKHVGLILRVLRHKQGWVQQEVEKRIPGLISSRLSELELGRVWRQTLWFEKLAEVLGTTEKKLLGGYSERELRMWVQSNRDPSPRKSIRELTPQPDDFVVSENRLIGVTQTPREDSLAIRKTLGSPRDMKGQQIPIGEGSGRILFTSKHTGPNWVWTFKKKDVLKLPKHWPGLVLHPKFFEALQELKVARLPEQGVQLVSHTAAEFLEEILGEGEIARLLVLPESLSWPEKFEAPRRLKVSIKREQGRFFSTESLPSDNPETWKPFEIRSKDVLLVIPEGFILYFPNGASQPAAAEFLHHTPKVTKEFFSLARAEVHPNPIDSGTPQSSPRSEARTEAREQSKGPGPVTPAGTTKINRRSEVRGRPFKYSSKTAAIRERRNRKKKGWPNNARALTHGKHPNWGLRYAARKFHIKLPQGRPGNEAKYPTPKAALEKRRWRRSKAQPNHAGALQNGKYKDPPLYRAAIKFGIRLPDYYHPAGRLPDPETQELIQWARGHKNHKISFTQIEVAEHFNTDQATVSRLFKDFKIESRGPEGVKGPRTQRTKALHRWLKKFGGHQGPATREILARRFHVSFWTVRDALPQYQTGRKKYPMRATVLQELRSRRELGWPNFASAIQYGRYRDRALYHAALEFGVKLPPFPRKLPLSRSEARAASGPTGRKARGEVRNRVEAGERSWEDSMLEVLGNLPLAVWNHSGRDETGAIYIEATSPERGSFPKERIMVAVYPDGLWYILHKSFPPEQIGSRRDFRLQWQPSSGQSLVLGGSRWGEGIFVLQDVRENPLVTLEYDQRTLRIVLSDETVERWDTGRWAHIRFPRSVDNESEDFPYFRWRILSESEWKAQRRILILDPRSEPLDRLREMFRREYGQVSTATTLSEAQDLVEKSPRFDFVVTEVDLSQGLWNPFKTIRFQGGEVPLRRAGEFFALWLKEHPKAPKKILAHSTIFNRWGLSPFIGKLTGLDPQLIRSRLRASEIQVQAKGILLKRAKELSSSPRSEARAEARSGPEEPRQAELRGVEVLEVNEIASRGETSSWVRYEIAKLDVQPFEALLGLRLSEAALVYWKSPRGWTAPLFLLLTDGQKAFTEHLFWVHPTAYPDRTVPLREEADEAKLEILHGILTDYRTSKQPGQTRGPTSNGWGHVIGIGGTPGKGQLIDLNLEVRTPTRSEVRKPKKEVVVRRARIESWEEFSRVVTEWAREHEGITFLEYESRGEGTSIPRLQLAPAAGTEALSSRPVRDHSLEVGRLATLIQDLMQDKDPAALPPFSLIFKRVPSVTESGLRDSFLLRVASLARFASGPDGPKARGEVRGAPITAVRSVDSEEFPPGHNQDTVWADPDRHFIVAADGVSGSTYGLEASQAVVKALGEVVTLEKLRAAKTIRDVQWLLEQGLQEGVRRLVTLDITGAKEIMSKQDKKISTEMLKDRLRKSPHVGSTTVLAAVLWKEPPTGKIYVVSVSIGDCRFVLRRGDGKVTIRTSDWDDFRPSQVYGDLKSLEKKEFILEEVQPGDRIYLMTDGVGPKDASLQAWVEEVLRRPGSIEEDVQWLIDENSYLHRSPDDASIAAVIVSRSGFLRRSEAREQSKGPGPVTPAGTTKINRRSEVHSAPTGPSTPQSSKRSASRAEVRSGKEGITHRQKLIWLGAGIGVVAATATGIRLWTRSGKVPWWLKTQVEDNLESVKGFILETIEWLIKEGYPHPELLRNYGTEVQKVRETKKGMGGLLGKYDDGEVIISSRLAGLIRTLQQLGPQAGSEDLFMESFVSLIAREAEGLELFRVFQKEAQETKDLEGQIFKIEFPTVFPSGFRWPSPEASQFFEKRRREISQIVAYYAAAELHEAYQQYKALDWLKQKKFYRPEEANRISTHSLDETQRRLVSANRHTELLSTQGNPRPILERELARHMVARLPLFLSPPPEGKVPGYVFSFGVFAFHEFERYVKSRRQQGLHPDLSRVRDPNQIPRGTFESTARFLWEGSKEKGKEWRGIKEVISNLPDGKEIIEAWSRHRSEAREQSEGPGPVTPVSPTRIYRRSEVHSAPTGPSTPQYPRRSGASWSSGDRPLGLPTPGGWPGARAEVRGEKEPLQDQRRVEMFTNEEAHALAQGMNQALQGAELVRRQPFVIDPERYGVESNHIAPGVSENALPTIFRMGPLIFPIVPFIASDPDFGPTIMGSDHKILEQELVRLRKTLGPLYSSRLGNIYFVTPSAYQLEALSRGFPISPFAGATIAVMLAHKESFKGATVIDFGSGDGLLARIALGLGARQVLLVERKNSLIAQSRTYLKDQGWREGEDFIILQGDLTQPEFTERLRKHSVVTRADIALANIGPWEMYGDANQEAAELVSTLPQIALFINGGYHLSDGIHRAVFERVRENFEHLRFHIRDYRRGDVRTLIATRPRAEVRSLASLAGVDLKEFRLRLTLQQEKIIAQILRPGSPIVISPYPLEKIPDFEGGGRLTDEELHRFFGLPADELQAARPSVFDPISGDSGFERKRRRYEEAWNGLLAKKDYPAYQKEYEEGVKRAHRAAWSRAHLLLGSLEKVREISFEEFARVIGAVEVPEHSGPGFKILTYVSREDYEEIRRMRERLARERTAVEADQGMSRASPEQAEILLGEISPKWWEASEIQPARIHIFTDQLLRERERGARIGKSALFHELVEEELSKAGLQDDSLMIRHEPYHRDLSVIEAELQFAALLGRREFRRAENDHKIEIKNLKAASKIASDERFLWFEERVIMILREANYRDYRRAGEVTWDRASRSEARAEVHPAGSRPGTPTSSRRSGARAEVRGEPKAGPARVIYDQTILLAEGVTSSDPAQLKEAIMSPETGRKITDSVDEVKQRIEEELRVTDQLPKEEKSLVSFRAMIGQFLMEMQENASRKLAKVLPPFPWIRFTVYLEPEGMMISVTSNSIPSKQEEEKIDRKLSGEAPSLQEAVEDARRHKERISAEKAARFGLQLLEAMVKRYHPQAFISASFDENAKNTTFNLNLPLFRQEAPPTPPPTPENPARAEVREGIPQPSLRDGNSSVVEAISGHEIASALSGTLPRNDEVRRSEVRASDTDPLNLEALLRRVSSENPNAGERRKAESDLKKGLLRAQQRAVTERVSPSIYFSWYTQVLGTASRLEKEERIKGILKSVRPILWQTKKAFVTKPENVLKLAGPFLEKIKEIKSPHLPFNLLEVEEAIWLTDLLERADLDKEFTDLRSFLEEATDLVESKELFALLQDESRAVRHVALQILELRKSGNLLELSEEEQLEKYKELAENKEEEGEAEDKTPGVYELRKIARWAGQEHRFHATKESIVLHLSPDFSGTRHLWVFGGGFEETLLEEDTPKARKFLGHLLEILDVVGHLFVSSSTKRLPEEEIVREANERLVHSSSILQYEWDSGEKALKVRWIELGVTWTLPKYEKREKRFIEISKGSLSQVLEYYYRDLRGPTLPEPEPRSEIRLPLKILIADKLEKVDGILALSRRFPGKVEVANEPGLAKNPEEFKKAVALRKPDVVIVRSGAKVTREILQSWSRNRENRLPPLVLRSGVDPENIDTEAAWDEGVVVARTHGNQESVANLFFRFLFAYLRLIQPELFDKAGSDLSSDPRWKQVVEMVPAEFLKAELSSIEKGRGEMTEGQRTFLFNTLRSAHEKEWKRSLKNLMTGFAGLGEIPEEIVKRLKALERVFGVPILTLAHSRSLVDSSRDSGKAKEKARRLGIEGTTKEDILRVADVISLHLPGKAGVFLGAEEFEILLKRSYSGPVAIINTSRESLVDHAALRKVLRNKPNVYYFADLDLTETLKSLRDEFPKQVFLTPHIAASTKTAADRVEKKTLQDLEEILQVYGGQKELSKTSLDFVVWPLLPHGPEFREKTEALLKEEGIRPLSGAVYSLDPGSRTHRALLRFLIEELRQLPLKENSAQATAQRLAAYLEKKARELKDKKRWEALDLDVIQDLFPGPEEGAREPDEDFRVWLARLQKRLTVFEDAGYKLNLAVNVSPHWSPGHLLFKRIHGDRNETLRLYLRTGAIQLEFETTEVFGIRSEVHSAPTGLSTPQSSPPTAARAEVRSPALLFRHSEKDKQKLEERFLMTPATLPWISDLRLLFNGRNKKSLAQITQVLKNDSPLRWEDPEGRLISGTVKVRTEDWLFPEEVALIFYPDPREILSHPGLWRLFLPHKTEMIPPLGSFGRILLEETTLAGEKVLFVEEIQTSRGFHHLPKELKKRYGQWNRALLKQIVEAAYLSGYRQIYAHSDTSILEYISPLWVKESSLFWNYVRPFKRWWKRVVVETGEENGGASSEALREREFYSLVLTRDEMARLGDIGPKTYPNGLATPARARAGEQSKGPGPVTSEIRMKINGRAEVRGRDDRHPVKQQLKLFLRKYLGSLRPTARAFKVSHQTVANLIRKAKLVRWTRLLRAKRAVRGPYPGNRLFKATLIKHQARQGVIAGVLGVADHVVAQWIRTHGFRTLVKKLRRERASPYPGDARFKKLLTKHGGRQDAVAKEMGVKQPTVWNWIRRHHFRRLAKKLRSGRLIDQKNARSETRNESRSIPVTHNFEEGLQRLDDLAKQKPADKEAIFVVLVGGGGMGTSLLGQIIASRGLGEVGPDKVAVLEGDRFYVKHPEDLMASAMETLEKDMLRLQRKLSWEDALEYELFLKEVRQAQGAGKRIIVVTGGFSYWLARRMEGVLDPHLIVVEMDASDAKRIKRKEASYIDALLPVVRLNQILNEVSSEPAYRPDLILWNDHDYTEEEMTRLSQPRRSEVRNKTRISQLIEELEGDDTYARERATNALGQIGREAVPALRGALKHEDPDVRFRAVWLLRQMLPRERTTDLALRKVLEKDPELSVRREARKAFASEGAATRQTSPVSRKTREKPEVRKETRPDAKPTVQALISQLKSEDAGRVRDAVLALAERGEPAVPALKKALRARDSDVRKNAVWALDELASQDKDALKEAVPDLTRLLKDEDAYIRKLSRKLLSKIKLTRSEVREASQTTWELRKYYKEGPGAKRRRELRKEVELLKKFPEVQRGFKVGFFPRLEALVEIAKRSELRLSIPRAEAAVVEFLFQAEEKLGEGLSDSNQQVERLQARMGFSSANEVKNKNEQLAFVYLQDAAFHWGLLATAPSTLAAYGRDAEAGVVASSVYDPYIERVEQKLAKGQEFIQGEELSKVLNQLTLRKLNRIIIFRSSRDPYLAAADLKLLRDSNIKVEIQTVSQADLDWMKASTPALWDELESFREEVELIRTAA